MKDIKWSFSAKTGNSSLRSHLESFHKTEYLQLCRDNEWIIMLPKMRKMMALEIGNSTTHGGESGNTPPRQPFSQSQFLKHLVNFIVSDDQVRIYIT